MRFQVQIKCRGEWIACGASVDTLVEAVGWSHVVEMISKDVEIRIETLVF